MKAEAGLQPGLFICNRDVALLSFTLGVDLQGFQFSEDALEEPLDARSVPASVGQCE